MNLEEVAKLAGVSRSTVSRVVNGDSRVSDSVRSRVTDIIRIHNYQPHAAARSLASSKTRMIGLQIPGAVSFIFGDRYFPILVQGVVDACNSADYSMMLMMEPQNDPPTAERIYKRVIRGRLLDGIILSTSLLDDPFIDRLIDDGIPAVLIGRHDGITTVDVDNRGASREAVAHLIDHGRKRIAHISGPHDVFASIDRELGYRDALSEAGLPIDERLIVQGRFRELDGQVGMRQLLDHPDGRPDAVFCGSDTMAVGALRAIYAAGLDVPGDIAVFGFDGLEHQALPYPYLSTVVQPIAAMGKAALDTLVRRINDPAGPVTHALLPTHLELRGSCGCAAADIQNAPANGIAVESYQASTLFALPRS